MNNNTTRSRMPIYAVGALLGLALGFLSAHLYAQSVEENHGAGGMPQVETGDVFRLGLSAIAFMRQITDLGARGQSK